ncbi:YfjP family GTPase, partial [Nonomuraea sp. 3-1Str]|uniref:YfjP family GTPase n=1 Tax=Nonomuraea sp. 3-1Str TaxID=2929801 RepID=UPI002862F883
MKLLRRKEGPPLDSRLDALMEAATLAGGRLPDGAVESARAVAERAGVRRSLSAEHTVVALAGATGSGKSSLFNALTGTEVAAVGVTRPTTSAVQAAVWDGDAGAGPLLDWLDVFTRHEAGTPTGQDFSGLILLDLPDHDSIRLDHRLEVDRLVELVDLLVWVLDPQKYADAALHERYLRPLSGHRDVMVVALNQADRLPPDAVDRCLRDVRRLLDEDDLKGVPVLATSARTGMGLPELRALLAGRVADRRAWAARLAADVTTAADLLATASTASTGSSGTPLDEEAAGETDEHDHPTTASPGTALGVLAAGREIARSAELPEAEPAGDVTARLGRRLTVALEEAAGVPLVLEAVAKGHRHRAVVATGWPVTRWIRRLRPDPLRRLRLGTGISPGPGPGAENGSRSGTGTAIAASGGMPAAKAPARRDDGRQIVGRTSLPAASAVQKARVETAIRDVGEAAAPPPPTGRAPRSR